MLIAPPITKTKETPLREEVNTESDVAAEVRHANFHFISVCIWTVYVLAARDTTLARLTHRHVHTLSAGIHVHVEARNTPEVRPADLAHEFFSQPK